MNNTNHPLSVSKYISNFFQSKRSKNNSGGFGETEYKTFLDLFHQSTAIMLLLEPMENGKHRILDANNAAAHFYGYSHKELIALNIGDINTANYEDIQKLTKIALKNRGNTFHLKHRLANKEVKDVQISASPITMAGKNLLYIIVQDISDKTKAIQELKEKQAYARGLFDLSPDGLFIINEQGIVLEANSIALELVGIDKEMIIGKNLFDTDILSEESKRFALNRIKEAFETKQLQVSEYVLNKRDKTQIIVEVKSQTLNISGSPQLLIRMQDITDRKQLEKQISESKNRFKMLSSVSFEGIVIHSNGLILDSNQAFEKLFEFEKNESIGQNILDYVSTPEHKKRMEKNINDSYLYPYEIVFTKKGGTNFTAEIEARDYKIDEKLYRVSSIRDITARKRQELVETVGTSITKAIIQDLEFEKLLQYIQSEINKLMDARNFYLAFFDIKKNSIVTPYISDDFTDVSALPLNGSLTVYLIEQKKSVLIDKAKLAELKKSGKITAVCKDPKQWLGIPLLRKEEVIGVFVVKSYTDENAYSEKDLKILEMIASQISIAIERKKREEDLKKALAKAQESDRLKSTFLATMSHELRTPLNAIIGFSEMAETDQPIEEIVEFCHIINNAGIHLLGIVNEIFDFTLIETGEIKLLYNEHNLSEILSDVHQIIKNEQQTLGKEHLELRFNIPPEAKNINLRTDRQRLQQVLLNLLKNALKFTNSGSIKYGFSLKEKEHKRVIQFYVEDTGIGIPKNQEEIIFDIFRQVDDTHARKHDGVGLGLSICKKIVSLMGGDIWLESTLENQEEGKPGSTTFYFDIPNTLQKIELTSSKDAN